MNSANAKSDEPAPTRAWPMRLWLAAPDWAFRVMGAMFFFGLIWTRLQKYRDENWNDSVPFCRFDDNTVWEMPWVPILVDLTFVLIALSFCFRIPPRTRASNGWVIIYTLFTGFAPLLLLWVEPLLGYINLEWQQQFHTFMWRQEFSWQLALTAGVLISIGNALDVWGYSILGRSFSIVPEPRELRTTGPYRFVRHPVYFGQFLAQAALMLIVFKSNFVWISLFVLFVSMQLYRSKLEDRVLEKAFGDPYREWKEKTFWFV